MSRDVITFKDHFSGHAASYATHRPSYPDELYRWLTGMAPSNHLVWDCATGNGQAALGLATYFKQVMASDASKQQIAQAQVHPRIEYRVEPAEQSSLDNASVDLVTVGQAYHWFDHDLFLAEVSRVLKPGGVLAIWTYGLLNVNPALDAVVNALYDNILGEYWPPERVYIDRNYKDFLFPWPEISVPAFTMSVRWCLADLEGYLNTWSALRRYEEQHGENPLQMVTGQLRDGWGELDEHKLVTWPLVVRCCQKPF